MRLRLVSLTLAVALMGTLTMSAVAQRQVPRQTVNNNLGLVAAVVQVITEIQADGSQVGLVNLDNSLNDLTVVELTNILNNSLNNVTVNVIVEDIDVLNDAQIDVLRDANINIGQLVGFAVLSGDQIIVFQR